ncbi:MAG TPA: YceI family protein [Steroidobacteraceae bacterium]|nr:YceI family protein [Steroidobacteraceae bacterium]
MRKFLFAFAALASACAAPPPAPPPAAPAAPVAAAPYERWEVTSSWLEIRVFRDGPLARLGHDHVITSTALAGRLELREPRARSGFTLTLPLDSLVVDDPASRAAAGPAFAAPVPDADRAGTLQNLLGPRVLDAALQPVLRLSADALEGGPEHYVARLRVSLRGEERVVPVQVSVSLDGDLARVHAHAVLRHADLGLVPFTVAMGALSVRDDIAIDCRLEARRAA